jgi:hypothetical protein
MMGSVAQLHDPEGDRLVALAQSLGEDKLSAGEKWRLANTHDRRRKHEASAALEGGRTDTLGAQRLEAIETRLTGLQREFNEVLPRVIGETIEETEAEAKKLAAELRAETEQKLNAQLDGFKRAVTQLRDEDRRALFEKLRETLGDAEAQIDASLAKALEAEKERSEIELALVRDEVLNVVAEKRYGQPNDDAPKLELAEKAIASLRKRLSAVEAEGARQAARHDALASMPGQLAECGNTTKSLLVRCAANALAQKKETARADDLADKVATLETTMAKLLEALLERKVIN